MSPRWLHWPEQVTTIGTLMIENGYASTAVGGVESAIAIDGSSTSTYPLTRMEFRDGTKDGAWTDDGLALLFECGTSNYANWVALLPTSSGLFVVYETGTSNELFRMNWTGSGAWVVGRAQRYGTTSHDYTGSVPANNTRVDVYWS